MGGVKKVEEAVGAGNSRKQNEPAVRYFQLPDSSR
jgi:hypothetical protein